MDVAIGLTAAFADVGFAVRLEPDGDLVVAVDQAVVLEGLLAEQGVAPVAVLGGVAEPEGGEQSVGLVEVSEP